MTFTEAVLLCEKLDCRPGILPSGRTRSEEGGDPTGDAQDMKCLLSGQRDIVMVDTHIWKMGSRRIPFFRLYKTVTKVKELLQSGELMQDKVGHNIILYRSSAGDLARGLRDLKMKKIKASGRLYNWLQGAFLGYPGPNLIGFLRRTGLSPEETGKVMEQGKEIIHKYVPSWPN